MADSAPRFREWFDAPAPELEKLPLDWRELDKRPFLKLLVVKCLRPDRITQVRPWSDDNRRGAVLFERRWEQARWRRGFAGVCLK